MYKKKYLKYKKKYLQTTSNDKIWYYNPHDTGDIVTVYKTQFGPYTERCYLTDIKSTDGVEITVKIPDGVLPEDVSEWARTLTRADEKMTGEQTESDDALMEDVLGRVDELGRSVRLTVDEMGDDEDGDDDDDTGTIEENEALLDDMLQQMDVVEELTSAVNAVRGGDEVKIGHDTGRGTGDQTEEVGRAEHDDAGAFYDDDVEVTSDDDDTDEDDDDDDGFEVAVAVEVDDDDVDLGSFEDALTGESVDIPQDDNTDSFASMMHASTQNFQKKLKRISADTKRGHKANESIGVDEQASRVIKLAEPPNPNRQLLRDLVQNSLNG